MFSYLVAGLILGLPAAAQPGPFQAYLLAQSLTRGWRRTLPAALAPLISDVPIIAITLLLLTQLPDLFLRVIRVGGGLFILYLAWGAWQAWRTADFSAPDAEAGSERQRVSEAALMNFLNPNPWIFWLIVGGPILLEAWRESVASAVGFILGIYVALIGGFMLLIVLFGVTARLGPQVSRALTAVAAVALAGFGLFQIVAGLR